MIRIRTKLLAASGIVSFLFVLYILSNVDHGYTLRPTIRKIRLRRGEVHPLAKVRCSVPRSLRSPTEALTLCALCSAHIRSTSETLGLPLLPIQNVLPVSRELRHPQPPPPYPTERDRRLVLPGRAVDDLQSGQVRYHQGWIVTFQGHEPAGIPSANEGVGG